MEDHLPCRALTSAAELVGPRALQTLPRGKSARQAPSANPGTHGTWINSSHNTWVESHAMKLPHVYAALRGWGGSCETLTLILRSHISPKPLRFQLKPIFVQN